MTRRDALSKELLPPEDSTNLALWLDRYSLGFDQEIARAHLASTLTTIRVPEGYQQAFERRKKLLGGLNGGFENGETRRYTIAFSGRAILGIGMASVRETNLSLLRPWGLPYIAGSSLKGLASHVAHDAGGDWTRPPQAGGEAGALQRAIFGDVTGAGAILFHDAWWIPMGERPPIHNDTMTVHHGDYYSGTKEAPLDWEEPTPVSFLTISGSYLFAMSGPPAALDLAEQILQHGLAHRGVGAKTAAGYGRASLERVQSEFVRKMDGHQRAAAQPNTVEHLTREFLQAVEGASLAEELAAAERAARRMVDANPKIWRTWLQSERCPPEAQRWFAIRPDPVVAAVSPKSPLPGGPTPAPEASTPVEEQAATAWVAPDKQKRPTLYVLLPNSKKPLEEELRKLKKAPTEADLAALSTASATEPASVLVVLKDGKRVQAIRLAP